MQVHPSPTLPTWWGLALMPALCCLGCSGSGLNPVQGKVLYNDQPAKGALVTFHPKGADDVNVIRPTGFTKSDGTFTLTTGKEAGAPAGEYVVTIIWPEEVKSKGISMAPPDSQDRLNGAYANQKTSTLKVEIRKGTNQLDPFNLK